MCNRRQSRNADWQTEESDNGTDFHSQTVKWLPIRAQRVGFQYWLSVKSAKVINQVIFYCYRHFAFIKWYHNTMHLTWPTDTICLQYEKPYCRSIQISKHITRSLLTYHPKTLANIFICNFANPNYLEHESKKHRFSSNLRWFMLEDGCPQGLIWATGALRCTVRLIYRHCDLERTISEANGSRIKLSVYAKSSRTGFQEHIAFEQDENWK